MRDEKRERSDADDEPDDDLIRLLDEAAVIEAAERAEAEQLVDAPGVRDVERILASEWERSPARTTPRSKWPMWGLACLAAAMFLFFVVRWSMPTESDGPRGQYLGSDRFEITSPRDLVREWPKRIVWTADPAAREYAVDVLDDESGRVIADLGRTIATEIEFPSQESVEWPSKIEIRVKALRKDGSQGSTSAHVELVK